jgi:probable phosphoglycerate mutase
MKLIFCRHGETLANLEDKFQGVSDTELTEKGKNQAHRLNTYLKTLPQVDKFIISPFPRVISTYKIASEGIDAEVMQEEAIREMSYGDFETKPRHEIDKSVLEEREKDRFNYSHPGHHNNIPGDSYATLYKRIASFLDDLTEETNNDKTIVLISHQGVLVCVRKYFLGLSDKDAGSLRVPNNEIFIVTKEENEPLSMSVIQL